LADCAKTAAAEELDLEEEELQGENFASPVSLDDMRELQVYVLPIFRLPFAVKLC